MALTKRQNTALRNHKPHHTPTHMRVMRKEMNAGKTFGQAHKTAIKKVGK